MADCWGFCNIHPDLGEGEQNEEIGVPHTNNPRFLPTKDLKKWYFAHYFISGRNPCCGILLEWLQSDSSGTK